ncbi:MULTISPECIES: WXG100 family type VII secretion target [Streptomyces]|uniref:WXG100 family type VII secretion target n=1 Tax=Streptomyces TaxID=1883 RepID=UPI000F742441|nr:MULTISPECIES: WXG100 family type VII secretion target [Streptomyces]RSR96939.1 WXG100 family type VII secretion target [Streptomyces sp. WAC00469]GGV83815.1 hypothetical protein GCM10010499_51360 [Streptomyces thermoviolaceus subsp. apingens]
MAGKQKLEKDPVVKLQQDMSTKYENIRKRVHNLQQVIDSLEGQWQGIGRAAFDKKQYEINESLKNIGQILAEVIEGITKTRHVVDSKEDDVRASINRIDVRDGAPTVSPFASM